MANIRCNSEGKIQYYCKNIPVGFAPFRFKNYDFTIFAQNKNHVEDSWYNGRFIGDYYAVFRKKDGDDFWQQCGKWYSTFGRAYNRLQREMYKVELTSYED